jgi:hypothetical protein
LNAEFTNNRGVPFRDTIPKELAEARKNNPELGRLEDQIWKDSQGTLLNGFLGIGEKPKEQSLVVYINNKDGSLLYDRQYNSVFNPKTGEYSTIPLPKIVPAPEGYRLFLLEHTHPWVFSFGVASGPVRGPSPADALWAKNNPGAYHAVQVQPPADYPKQIYYYGPKR